MNDSMQDKILTQANDMFRADGIRRVSIDDICRQLGMSKKTFYAYYPTKDDLVKAILFRHQQRIQAQAKQAIDGKPIIDLMIRFVEAAQKIDDVRKIPVLVFDLRKYYPDLFAEHMQMIYQLHQKLMVELLERGIEDGLFRKEVDVEMCSMFFAQLHVRLMDELPAYFEKMSIKRLAHFVCELMVRGIITPEGEALLRLKMTNK